VEIFEIFVRIGVALAVGAVIGLNRDLQGKPAGVRTHSLVCIGSAGIVLAEILSGGTDEGISRVMQGILAGVGFLGAGVILRRQGEQRVQGLSTAATIWMAAVLGAASGRRTLPASSPSSAPPRSSCSCSGVRSRTSFARLAGGRKPAGKPDRGS
jgi:uncharacterized membrane protein YhiD involved in acid resistance